MRVAALVAVVAVAAAVATTGCPARSERPNIVLITLDTTRPDRLRAYGSPTARTPNLDAFAQEAVIFERAYATSSWTLASHASIFTGLLPMQHGAQSVPGGSDRSLGYGVRPLADSFETLAELLQADGYRTGAVIAGPALRRELGVAQGFEVYDDGLAAPGEKRHGKRGEHVANRAIELVESFGGDPYFLFVNFFDPHAPYRPPPPFDGDLPPAAELEKRLATDASLGKLIEALNAGDPAVPRGELDSEVSELLELTLSGYDAEITYMDHQLGRLLDALGLGRRRRPTVVIVTADHGESFGEHYFISHGAHLYEHNVRVPLMVRHPGGEPRGRVSEPVQNHRIFASVLVRAGVAVPGEVGTAPLEATSAQPPIVLEVNRSDANVRLFGKAFDRDRQAIYRPPYKLIESSDGRVELYDLDRDPNELVNLAPVQAETVRGLRGELAAIRRELGPMFTESDRADLRPGTAEALKALGYLD